MVLLAGLGLWLGAPGALQSETVYTAILDGPTSNTPSPATGTAVLTLNDAQTEIQYVVIHTELLTPEFAAHFHNAPPGLRGPVMAPLPNGSPKIGTWAVGPFEVGELNAGRVYVNVHSLSYIGGEIRGNLAPQTVAADESTWGAVKILYR